MLLWLTFITFWNLWWHDDLLTYYNLVWLYDYGLVWLHGLIVDYCHMFLNREVVITRRITLLNTAVDLGLFALTCICAMALWVIAPRSLWQPSYCFLTCFLTCQNIPSNQILFRPMAWQGCDTLSVYGVTRSRLSPPKLSASFHFNLNASHPEIVTAATWK